MNVQWMNNGVFFSFHNFNVIIQLSLSGNDDQKKNQKNKKKKKKKKNKI
jgi:hypothetical protein